MTEKLIQFEGGDVLANLEARTITGLLIPFNEVGRTNVGRFQVEAGTVTLPTDPSIVGLNTDHERSAVVGRATTLEEKADGIYATLTFANTPEGDAALADAVSPTGKRRKLSGEFGPAMIKAGRLVAGHAKLWGAALVEAGAFPSAQVLAADTPDEPSETTETFSDSFTDEAEKTFKRTTTRTTRTEPDGEGGTKTTITEKTVLEEPEAPAAAETEEEPPVSVPNTLASKAGTPASTRPPIDLQNVFAAISTLKSNPNADDARQVLAALSDIKISGANSLPIGGGAIRENWVGELYAGIPYVREFVTLGKYGTNITATGKKGFRVRRGTAASPLTDFQGVVDWAGNKAAIGSGTGFTQSASSNLHRFAFGADVAREFYDLPGGIEIIEAFLRLIVEDHLIWSDRKALAAWIAAAGAPVAPNVPASVDDAYSGTLGMLIQGILRVKAAKTDGRRDKPTFAILNEAAFEELSFTPFEKIPEYLKFSVSTDGTGTADGDVKLVVGDIGIEDSPAVLVGADYAIEFDELAGGPLHIDALHIANGGIDKAVHGYLQEFTVRPEAVVLVGEADA